MFFICGGNPGCTSWLGKAVGTKGLGIAVGTNGPNALDDGIAVGTVVGAADGKGNAVGYLVGIGGFVCLTVSAMGFDSSAFRFTSQGLSAKNVG